MLLIYWSIKLNHYHAVYGNTLCNGKLVNYRILINPTVCEFSDLARKCCRHVWWMVIIEHLEFTMNTIIKGKDKWKKIGGSRASVSMSKSHSQPKNDQKFWSCCVVQVISLFPDRGVTFLSNITLIELVCRNSQKSEIVAIFSNSIKVWIVWFWTLPYYCFK